MPVKPILDNAVTVRGAQMGCGWIMPMDKGTAAHIMSMYESDPPTTETERRHLVVARGALLPVKSIPGETVKVSLRCVRLDAGGYDSGGAYWGLGQPLYYAGSDDGRVDMWFRACSRDGAKQYVQGKYAFVTFYR